MEKCTSENRGSNSLEVFLDFSAPLVRIVFQQLQNPSQEHSLKCSVMFQICSRSVFHRKWTGHLREFLAQRHKAP